MNYLPLVSIVIPVYNGSNFIIDAIGSAFAQTYPNIEIIVINDGSDDGGETERIVKQYGDRVIYIAKQNGGVSSALNAGIRAARGEWISWLSHDDVYLPDKIEFQIHQLNQLLEKQIDISRVILHSATIRINSKGNVISKKIVSIPDDLTPHETFNYHIRNYNIGGCTVLIRKSTIEEAGFFDENVRTVSDAQMWFDLLLRGYSFRYIRKPLVKSRQHKQQIGNTRCSLFLEEHNQLMLDLAKKVVEQFSRREKEQAYYAFLHSGHGQAAKIVLGSLKDQGEYRSLPTKFFAFYHCLFYRSRCFLRAIYRIITLR